MFLYISGKYPNWAALSALFAHVVQARRNAGILGVALAHLVKDGFVEHLA
jgi:hypothetical protein